MSLVPWCIVTAIRGVATGLEIFEKPHHLPVLFFLVRLDLPQLLARLVRKLVEILTEHILEDNSQT